MANIPLPFPTRGINDNSAYSEQSLDTTRDAKNVTSVDPVTGRVRGGSRAGHEKFCDTRLSASGKVACLSAVTSDVRRVTYSNDSGTSAWANVAPSSQDVSNLKTDRYGNVYAIDGNATIVKYNPAGAEIWRFNVPVRDAAHVCRALAIDAAGHVYVGVSEGGDQKKADLFCYAPDDDLKLVQFWNTPMSEGGYIEDVLSVDDKLYSVENHPDKGRSYLRVYDYASTPEVELVAERPIPHPVNGITINPSGEIITSHEATTSRGYDPSTPTYTQVLDYQRWTPESLERWSERAYCWLSADKIKEQVGYEDVKEGTRVKVWEDLTGHGRNLYEGGALVSGALASGARAFQAPIYRESGLGGRPGLAFMGNDYFMRSLNSIGKGPNTSDAQPTILPGQGKGFILFMVLRAGDDDAASTEGRVFLQHNDVKTNDFEIWLNNKTGNTGGTEAGAIAISLDTRASAALGAGNVVDTSDPVYVTNRNGAVILTVYCDADSLDTGDDSYFRVNGLPVSKFSSDLFGTDTQHFNNIGCYFSDGTKGCNMILHEILVLQSYDDNGSETLGTVPDYSSNNTALAFNATSNTEVERVEGYLAWKYGISDLLDRGSETGATRTFDDNYTASRYCHPFHSNGWEQDPVPYPDSSYAPPDPDNDTRNNSLDGTRGDGLLSLLPMVVKWTSRLETRWVRAYAATGYAAVSLSDNSLVTVGARAGTDLTTVRGWTDEGDTLTVAWTVDTGYDYVYAYPRLASDEHDNVWVPGNWSDATTTLVGYDSAGTEIVSYAAASSQPGRAVAVHPVYPDYGAQSITRPEYVYVGTENAGDATFETVHKIRVVSSVHSGIGAPRSTKALGVCGGNIVTFSSTAAPSVPTGGANALSTSASLVCAIPAYGKVYFLDGMTYKVYDPREDKVTDWASTGAGDMPARCRWGVMWRGRMVLIRGEDAHNWHMFKQGDPTNLDVFPAVQTTQQAISGNTAGSPGLVPDIINTAIPMGKERLLFGCDHSIHAMYGDPLEGGVIVEVSTDTGLSFGPGWCFDSDGVLYAFGSRGGVYVIGGDLSIRRLTTDTIDRRMQAIDFSTYYIDMSWNTEDDTLYVCQCPYGAGGTAVKRWRWERKTQSWWEDEFSNTDVQPTCSFVLDGDDSDDRALLFGCEDGYVRTVSRTAKTDDGYTIDSYVTIGPVSVPGAEARIRDPKIQLADSQDGCEIQLFSSDTPETIGEIVASADLEPGQNYRKSIGARGSYLWVRLRNVSTGQRWAYEGGTIGLWPTGRRVVS